MPPSGVFEVAMDDDALIEAEIAQELELINLDADDNFNDLPDDNVDDQQQEDEEVLHNDGDLPGEVSDYIKRMQEQTAAFEKELAECDELLHRSKSSLEDPLSLVPIEDDALVLELARENGESPTAYRKRILEEVERETMDLSEEAFLTGDVVGLKEENEGKSTALVLLDERTLEFQRMFRAEMDALEKRQHEKEEIMKKEIEEDREREEKETEEKETKWKEKFDELKREETTLAKNREAEQEKFEEVAKKREQEMEAELEQFQKEIDKMAEEAEKEKAEFIKAKEEELQKREESEEKGAVTIQRHFRGHIVRKQYREALQEKEEERKKKWEEERIKQVELELQKQREKMERKKREEEEEKLRKEKEEQMKKEEEERVKREKEEKKKKELEEKKRKEEEEKQRKEQERLEKLRKEEEKRKEEERKKEELRRKEEERRRKEEEKKRTEEEARLKEEQRKKEESERKRLEEEKRIEEMKIKEEEERIKAEEEKKKREDEERVKKEEEEKLKKEEEERTLKEEEGKRRLENSEVQEGEKTLTDIVRENEKPRDNTFVSAKSVDKTFVLDTGAMGNGATDDHDDDDILKPDEDTKERSRAVNVMLEGLPDPLERRRLQWIKDCTPWSKVSNEPWKLKAGASKRAVRRPASAKKLSPLDEKVILSAAHVDTLRQVTTVELHNLPGTSITTLGQCWGLKHLTMTNCKLTVIEGLQQCKQLQYVNFKENSIEYVDLKDLGNISYMDISRNNLSVIHGLNGCTNLRWLDLSHNKVTRLGGLDSLRRLHTLILSHNQLITSSCLSDTPTIQSLDLSHNHLQKLEDLEKLCLLQSLNVSSNNLLQLPTLQNHVLLQELILEDNSITSLKELQSCWLPVLHTLNLGQNSVEEMISMEQFHILKHLDISNNQILEPEQITDSIRSCVYLETLRVLGNPAVEDSPLRVTDILPRLCTLDDVASKAARDTGTPLKPSNSFQAMCLTQVQLFRDMSHRFQQDVKQLQNKSPVDVPVLCDTYFKFCDKSNKIACDHRYAHEYGDVTMTMPVAPSTPKSSRPRSSRSAKIVQREETYQNPKDMFNKLVSSQDKNAVTAQTENKYSNPKDMFEKAVKGESDKNSSQNYEKGFGAKRGDIGTKNGLLLEKTVVISAKTVKDLMEKDTTFVSASSLKHVAATKIQAHWRGYSIRKYLFGNHGNQENQDYSEMAVLMELHKAATKIQAVWRGFILRLKLERAIEYARFVDDDEDYQEVDLSDFNFDENVLDDWRPPTTPQIPSAHPVLGKPPSGKQPSPPGKVPPLHLTEKHLPPVKPQRAWRGAESPMSDVHQNGHLPHPPPSVISGSDTHRTVLSKKEEKLSEEWGFKDTNTAHLMMQRAKKMKYNSERRKKISKLDPKQRLALFKRLEDSGTMRKPVYHQPNKQTLPRKEYFQARQEEMERHELEKRVMHNMKNDRTFEWLHTQVGDYEVTDSAINQSRKPALREKFGSEGNLPRMDPEITAGRPPRLMASPSLDIQSVDSVSLQGEMTQPRRFSAGSDASAVGRFPPIKTNSAGSSHSQGSRKRERISWRNKEVNQSVGWGGGKKRGKMYE